MARTLKATVIIGEESYVAGSAPPDDVAEQITNPAAWADEEAPKEEVPQRHEDRPAIAEAPQEHQRSSRRKN